MKVRVKLVLRYMSVSQEELDEKICIQINSLESRINSLESCDDTPNAERCRHTVMSSQDSRQVGEKGESEKKSRSHLSGDKKQRLGG